MPYRRSLSTYLSYLRTAMDRIAKVRAAFTGTDSRIVEDLDLTILKLNSVYDYLLDLDGDTLNE